MSHNKIILWSLILCDSLYAINFFELKEYAYENSKYLKFKEFDRYISEKDLLIINSERYPELSLGINIESSKSLNNNSNTSVGGETISNDSLSKSYSYLNLNYNLYSFGRFESRVKSQEYLVESKKFEFCQEQTNLITNLLEYYYNGRNQQEKNLYLNKIIEEKNKIYSYNQRLFKLGDITKIELMKSSLEVAELYSQISQNKESLKESLESIFQVSNYKFKSNEVLNPLFVDHIKRDVDFKKTSSSRSIISQIKSKNAELTLIKSEYLPNLNFYSKYDFYGSHTSSFNKSIKDLKENSFKFGLSLSWSLFNGYKTTSQKEKALLELKQLKNKYEFEKDKFYSSINILDENYALEKLTSKNKYQILEVSYLNENYSKRLNNVGEINKIAQINLKIEKLYKELEYKMSREKLAYEYIKKSLLLGDNRCTVH